MPFRLDRKKIGLTYSCPTDAENNPITSVEELKIQLESHGTLEKYIISEELHENGKRHYHAHLVYAEPINTVNERFFDFKDVHPNIIKPGKGWPDYCAKHGEFITNFYKRCSFKRAREADSWAEASAVLWESEPKFMLQHGSQAEHNWKRRKLSNKGDRVFFGPAREPPDAWQPETHALIIEGPSGVGKTQWALDWARHHGDGTYLKCTHYQHLKEYKGESCLIFDDCDESLNVQDVSTWISLTDVEQERQFRVLHGCVSVPAVPKIFLTNGSLRYRDNAAGAVKRRVCNWNFICY